MWPPAALACWPNARYHHTTVDFQHYQEGTLFFLLHFSYRVSISYIVLKATKKFLKIKYLNLKLIKFTLILAMSTVEV